MQKICTAYNEWMTEWTNDSLNVCERMADSVASQRMPYLHHKSAVWLTFDWSHIITVLQKIYALWNTHSHWIIILKIDFKSIIICFGVFCHIGAQMDANGKCKQTTENLKLCTHNGESQSVLQFNWHVSMGDRLFSLFLFDSVCFVQQP